MAENENPEPNMSFKLTLMNVATHVLFPILSLCETEFNPQCLGMMEFTENGFEITVRNPQTHAVAKLFLNSSSGLIDYHCNNPILTKIDLREMYSYLIHAIHYHLLNPSLDHRIVTVFHLQGSNKLIFSCGSPAIEFELGFMESNGEFYRFPDIVEFDCEVLVYSDMLRLMIHHVNDPETDLVFIGIADEVIRIDVGLLTDPILHIKKHPQDPRMRILTEERDHLAIYELYHLTALTTAAILGEVFRLRFLSQPEKYVMIRFDLKELGYFVFVHKARVMVRAHSRLKLGTSI